jgi:type II secretory pathway pseudopilin PulG
MKKIKTNQYGFALIIPIVAAVLVFGVAGTQVYRVQQAKKMDSQLSASQKEAEDKQKLANELKAAQEAKQKEDEKKDEKKDAVKAEDTPATSEPKPAPAPAPKPAPSIVHPTISDCGKGKFTVYASVKTGTKAYTSQSMTNAFATYSYGKALSLECYTYASGKPYPGWLLYNDGFIKYSDVSKTKP